MIFRAINLENHSRVMWRLVLFMIFICCYDKNIVKTTRNLKNENFTFVHGGNVNIYRII